MTAPKTVALPLGDAPSREAAFILPNGVGSCQGADLGVIPVVVILVLIDLGEVVGEDAIARHHGRLGHEAVALLDGVRQGHEADGAVLFHQVDGGRAVLQLAQPEVGKAVDVDIEPLVDEDGRPVVVVEHAEDETLALGADFT